MRTILITGTSGGLGNALFDQFAAQDVRVVALSRRFLPEQETAAKENFGRLVLVHADLLDSASLPSGEQLSELLAGSEEIVFINNAATVEPIGEIGALAAERIAEAVQVNVTAALQLTNALFAAEPVKRAAKVTVLNISSGAAKRVIEHWSVYCSVKAGNEMFFNALAAQFKDDARVQVHNVNPGVMDTRMQQTIRAAGEFPGKERYVGLHEEGKLPSPVDVARDIAEKYL